MINWQRSNACAYWEVPESCNPAQQRTVSFDWGGRNAEMAFKVFTV
jgi:hypothetical protein